MNGLTRTPVHPQIAQYLSSYVRVTGHEPSAEEIADFEARHNLAEPRSLAPIGDARQAADASMPGLPAAAPFDRGT